MGPKSRDYSSLRLVSVQLALDCPLELSLAKNISVASNKKKGKNHPMVPPLNHFQGENKICSSLARTISASRGSFLAKLTTFERRSGLKIFSLLKIPILKME